MFNLMCTFIFLILKGEISYWFLFNNLESIAEPQCYEDFNTQCVIIYCANNIKSFVFQVITYCIKKVLCGMFLISLSYLYRV